MAPVGRRSAAVRQSRTARQHEASDRGTVSVHGPRTAARSAVAFHRSASARRIPCGARRAGLSPASGDTCGESGCQRYSAGRRARPGPGQADGIGANRRGVTAPSVAGLRRTKMLGVPLGELAVLAAAIVIGGVITGLLPGLFGVGGGAVIVPVLYEIFRALSVAEEVRMQLCVGTSLAIIVPT